MNELATSSPQEIAALKLHFKKERAFATMGMSPDEFRTKDLGAQCDWGWQIIGRIMKRVAGAAGRRTFEERFAIGRIARLQATVI